VSEKPDAFMAGLLKDGIIAVERPSTVPCPFCGKANLHLHRTRTVLPPDDPHAAWSSVICMGCGATGPRSWAAQEAVDKWEKRV